MSEFEVPEPILNSPFEEPRERWIPSGVMYRRPRADVAFVPIWMTSGPTWRRPALTTRDQALLDCV